ncbi:MAG: prolyl-tRNA synthetase associated domain-containing protein [Promethearchaeota archaeon]
MDATLKQWLDRNKIAYILHTHPPVFTVPEAQIHCGHIPGTHCKNLFLQDKRDGQFYLITIPSNQRLDLKKFRKQIGASKIRFGSVEALQKLLGLTAGSVSPIGLVNDTDHQVIYLVARTVWDSKKVNFHPNINNETLELTREAYHDIIQACGPKFRVMEFDYLVNEEEKDKKTNT